jgi:DinB superfamily
MDRMRSARYGLLLMGLALTATAQAAPARFHQAVSSLSRMLFIQTTDDDTYLVSENIRVHYDRASSGILVTKTGVPLEDQGIFIATKLIPSWCGLDIQYLHVKYLTGQMARSARLRALVSFRMGRCEVQSLSAGTKSFILLRSVPGALVWPPRLGPGNAVSRSLLTDALSAEFQAFGDVLSGCPAAQFNTPPQHGHSASWHALHIMDWTRATIQPGLKGANPELTYGYLGFEDQPWAQAVTGPTLAQESDSKDVILNVVRGVLADALEALRTAPDERFSTEAMWDALNKPRPVLGSLMYHLTHTAYHRGQIRQLYFGLKVIPTLSSMVN